MRMNESTLIKQHFYGFNSIVMNLNNIDVKIDNKNQMLIILCLLSSSYENFIDTLLYEKNSLDDISNVLKSKELKKKLLRV